MIGTNLRPDCHYSNTDVLLVSVNYAVEAEDAEEGPALFLSVMAARSIRANYTVLDTDTNMSDVWLYCNGI